MLLSAFHHSFTTANVTYKSTFFITKYLFDFSYIGKAESAQQWGLLAPQNITNPTWFLSLGTKTRSLVSSSWESLRSLHWLLLLHKEDQMQRTHANRDMMWHVVKWASIMHTPWRRGRARRCFCSTVLARLIRSEVAGGEAAPRRCDDDWQAGQQGEGIKNEPMTRTSQVFVIARCIFQCLTHVWDSEQEQLQTVRGTRE